MKKLFFALTGLILLLAGCGGAAETTDSGEISGSIQVAVEGNYTDYMTRMGAAFTEETGVEVEVIEAGMFEVVEALPTQQGNSADVFMLPNDRVGDLGSQKLLAPVTTDLSDYTETAQTAATYEGETYMLPMATDTTLFIYNKELLDEVPSSLSDLDAEDWAGKFTDFYFTAGSFISEGGYIFGSDNTDTSDIGLNNEGSVKAGTELQNLYNSGAEHWTLMQDDTVAYDVMQQAFKDGQIKAVIDGPWALSAYAEAGIDYAVAPIPSLTGNSDFAPLVGTKGLGINAYSSNIAAANAFLEFLNSPENATEFYNSTLEVNPRTTTVYEEGSTEKTILDATTQGTSMPTDPAFGKAWGPMKSALGQIASGEDVQAALDAAADTIASDIASMQ